ncbi:hypothetical protein [Microvirga sp. 2TAF3]|uniref:hypothetical protein n=1 Tax=Microvirga sp. 2TAF3 TaxID=3233014 RepID=UPI003F9ACA8A
MRRIILKTVAAASAGAFPLLATSAFAQMASTRSMSCEQARGMVASEGAAVLSTGPDQYDRYVSSLSSCQVDQILEPAWVPTEDTPQCSVGYKCRSPGYEILAVLHRAKTKH